MAYKNAVTLKDKVFKEYEKALNRIDDLTEYREFTREDIRAILSRMNSNIGDLQNGR